MTNIGFFKFPGRRQTKTTADDYRQIKEYIPKTYRDDFTQSNGSSLGVFSDLSLSWENIGSGSGWTVQSGSAYNTSSSSSTLAFVQAPSKNATITVQNSGVPEGGQGIAFRIKDSSNYWIFATYVYYGVVSTTYNPCAVANAGPWGAWSADTNGCGTISGSQAWTTTTYTSGSCIGYVEYTRQYEWVSGSCGTGWRSRSYLTTYSGGYNYTYGPRYSYKLYKVVSGTASEMWSGTDSTFFTYSDLKVIVKDSNIKCYINNLLQVDINDSYLETESKFGIGRSPNISSYAQSFHWTSFEMVA